MSLTLDVLKAISLGLRAGAIKSPDIEMLFSPGQGGTQKVTLLSLVEEAIAETQRPLERDSPEWDAIYDEGYADGARNASSDEPAK